MMNREEYDAYQAKQLQLAFSGSSNAEEKIRQAWERRYPRELPLVKRELVMRDIRLAPGVLERYEEFGKLLEIGGVKVWYPSDIDRMIAEQTEGRLVHFSSPAGSVEIGP